MEDEPRFVPSTVEKCPCGAKYVYRHNDYRDYVLNGVDVTRVLVKVTYECQSCSRSLRDLAAEQIGER